MLHMNNKNEDDIIYIHNSSSLMRKYLCNVHYYCQVACVNFFKTKKFLKKQTKKKDRNNNYHHHYYMLIQLS